MGDTGEQGDLYFERIGEHFDEWMSDYDVSRRQVLIGKLLPLEARPKNGTVLQKRPPCA